jgi:hypothetical protein
VLSVLIGKQKKPILFKVTEPSSIPYRTHSASRSLLPILVTWASPQGPETHTWRCCPVGSEVLAKVFLAHCVCLLLQYLLQSCSRTLLPGFLSNPSPDLFQSSLVRFYQSPTPGCETVVGALNQGFPFSLLQCMQGRTRVAEAEPLRLPPSDSLGIPNGTVLNGNVTASGQLEALLHVAGGHPSAARRHASRTPA